MEVCGGEPRLFRVIAEVPEDITPWLASSKDGGNRSEARWVLNQQARDCSFTSKPRIDRPGYKSPVLGEHNQHSNEMVAGLA